MHTKKQDILYYVGLLTAIWYTLTGMVWTYGAALIIAYPAGLISLLIWIKLKRQDEKRIKYIPLILVIGTILSLSVLVYYWIYE